MEKMKKETRSGYPCFCPTHGGHSKSLARLIREDERDILEVEGNLKWALNELHLRAEELAQSQENYRKQAKILQSVLNCMGEGVVVSDLKGEFFVFNPMAQKIVGLGPMQIGTSDWPKKYGIFLPDMVTPFPADQLALARAMQGEAVDNSEAFIRNPKVPDGRWVRATARPLVDDQGKIAGGVVVFRDISAEKKRTLELEQQAVFSELLKKIAVSANEATNVEDALQTGLGDICMQTGWLVGHAFLKDRGGELVSTNLWHYLTNEKAETSYKRRLEVFEEITRSTRFSPGKGLIGKVMATGKPQWIRDIWNDPTFLRSAGAEGVGFKSIFAFPVLVGRTVVGVLEFFSTETKEPDEPFLDVMAQVGIQLGRVVERVNAMRALRECVRASGSP